MFWITERKCFSLSMFPVAGSKPSIFSAMVNLSLFPGKDPPSIDLLQFEGET
jgi:hypothetical protein